MRRFRFVKVLVLVLAGCAVMSSAVWWLWNSLMPEIFGLRRISWWQALGLLVLSKLLVGGFHRHGHDAGMRQKQRAWKRQMRRQWTAMSDEERERFRTGMRKHWTCGWEAGSKRNAADSGQQATKGVL